MWKHSLKTAGVREIQVVGEQSSSSRLFRVLSVFVFQIFEKGTEEMWANPGDVYVN